MTRVNSPRARSPSAAFDLGRGAAQHLFVQLGQLPADGELPLGQHLGDHGQRFEDAIGRLESDGGSRSSARESQQAAHLAGLARQVAEEGEAGTSVAGDRERRGDRAWPGMGTTVWPAAHAAVDQGLAGIRHRRRPGVADQGDIVLVEGRHHARQAASLHRRAIADQWFADAVAREQSRR